MLQLPTPTAGRNFSKAEIASITRGARIERRKAPARDPLVRLCERADKAMDDHVLARNARTVAKQKLSVEDGHITAASIPDALLNVYWQSGKMFTSEAHIDAEFRKAMAWLRRCLKDTRASLRKLAGNKNFTDLKYEREQAIESYKRKIELLPKYREPMKLAFRKESRRLDAVQRKAGLTQANADVAKTRKLLARLTSEIDTKKPTSIVGALALSRYVERRLWPDRAGWFHPDCFFPCNLARSLRRATDALQKAARNE